MKEILNPQALSPEESQEAYHEKAKEHPNDILELLEKAEAEIALCTPDEEYDGDRIALVTVQFGEGKCQFCMITHTHSQILQKYYITLTRRLSWTL